MSLSTRALDTLVDLVEIKLSCLEVYDRDDQRELKNLEICRQELLQLAGREDKAPGDLVAYQNKGRRGRRRAAA